MSFSNKSVLKGIAGREKQFRIVSILFADNKMHPRGIKGKPVISGRMMPFQVY